MGGGGGGAEGLRDLGWKLAKIRIYIELSAPRYNKGCLKTLESREHLCIFDVTGRARAWLQSFLGQTKMNFLNFSQDLYHIMFLVVFGMVSA